MTDDPGMPGEAVREYEPTPEECREAAAILGGEIDRATERPATMSRHEPEPNRSEPNTPDTKATKSHETQ